MKKNRNDIDIKLSLTVQGEELWNSAVLSWDDDDEYYPDNIEKFIDEAYPQLKAYVIREYNEKVKPLQEAYKKKYPEKG